MKKSLAFSLALAFSVAAAGTAFAAVSPFNDVPAKHWAYGAVSQLQKAGIVDGYDNKTFGGEKTMTRYEMAQVVGRALTKADKADTENKKLMDKLSAEFAAELNSMGVRVAALEKNQPNLKLTGQLDVRYQSKMKEKNDVSDVKGQYRFRLNGQAKVDDNTSFGLRMATATSASGTKFQYKGTWTTFGDTEANGTGNTISLDRAYITTKLGAMQTTIGAQAVKFGANDFVLDSGTYSFDGIRFEGKAGVVNLSANVGRFQKSVDLTSFEASSKLGKLTYGVGYARLKDNKSGDTYNGTLIGGKTLAKYLDVNAAYQVCDQLSVGGEYVTNSVTDGAYGNKGKAGLVFALYGDQKIAKKGDNNILVNYYKTNPNGLTQWTGMDTVDSTAADAYVGNSPYKGFNAKYTYGFSKTFTGWLFYEKVSDNSSKPHAQLGGYRIYRAGLTAKF